MSNEDNDQQGQEANQEATSETTSAFAKQMYSIPIVHDGINTVKSYKFGRFTIDLADAGARKVSDFTKPLSGHIEKADKMAAASVESLGRNFPFVKEPTDKIFSTLTEPAFQTITTVKKYHEQLGCKIEDNITLPGSRLVMSFDSQLTPLVNAFEVLLQKVVPDENGKRDIQDDQQIAQALRILQIAVATRDRCVEKVKKQLSTNTEQLRELQESSYLLSKATETVNFLVVNLRDTVQNPDLAGIQSYITSVIYKDEENLPKAVQARIIEYSTALLATTDSISGYIKANAQKFPYLQDRLQPMITFFEERYGEIVNEIKNGKGTPLEKAKNIIQLTTTHTLPLLRSTLTDLQEAIHFYTTSLNTSLHNQVNNVTQVLNVK